MNPTEEASEVIPQHWYAIALTAGVGRARPVGVARLGRRLVLWRDREGAVRCADAGCPHRGANLALGRVKDGELECFYHGFRYDSAGACTLMPCEGRSARPSQKLCLRMHRVREEHGFIWLWSGVDRADLPPIPWVPQAPQPRSWEAVHDTVWNARFSRVMEGMMDIHHFPFAHRRFAPRKHVRLDPYEVREEDGVIRTYGRLRKEDAPVGSGYAFRINIAFPGVIHLDFGGLQGAVVCTPVDDENTWIGVRYAQQWVRIPSVGWLLSWLSLQLEFRLIQPDDYRMVASALPRSGGRHAGHLVRADRACAMWHLLRRKALDRAASGSRGLDAQGLIQSAGVDAAPALPEPST